LFPSTGRRAPGAAADGLCRRIRRPDFIWFVFNDGKQAASALIAGPAGGVQTGGGAQASVASRQRGGYSGHGVAQSIRMGALVCDHITR